MLRVRIDEDLHEARRLAALARPRHARHRQPRDERLAPGLAQLVEDVRLLQLETFDAVRSGLADMFHSHIGYFVGKSPAFHFYSGVPFGFTADELFAWVRFGGGQALWDALSGEFDIKPFLCASTGTQMGGWFNKEIESAEDFKGLKMRIPGLGGDVLAKLGASPVSLPGGQIYENLVSGAIDATE